jgi:hypothetical protein
VEVTHEMVLTGTADSDSEEWTCPECGRRLLLRWPPNCQKIILERGNENVAHSGGKGDVRIGGVRVTPALADEEREWLGAAGIDWDAPAG